MHICLVFNLDTLSFNQFLFVVEPLNLSLWNGNKSALQFSCVSWKKIQKINLIKSDLLKVSQSQDEILGSPNPPKSEHFLTDFCPSL